MHRFAPVFLLAACTGSTTPPERAAEPAPEAPAADPASGVITLDSAAGQIAITPVYHATLVLQVGEVTVWVDPWSKGALADKPKADVLLLTDVHFDHLDEEAIAAVAKPDAVVVGPAAVAEKRKVDHVLGNGETAELGALRITATPMYNLVRGPEEGGVFHEKGRGNGYLVEVGGKRIYIAGDTECTDEMKALAGVDLAFLPMNLPYTMTPEEAGACVQAFRPGQVVPYHYAGSDLDAFVTAAGDVAVRKAEFYPGGQPW